MDLIDTAPGLGPMRSVAVGEMGPDVLVVARLGQSQGTCQRSMAWANSLAGTVDRRQSNDKMMM